MIKDGKFWKEVRCTNCRRLLALEYIFEGRIEIKCKCGEQNIIKYLKKEEFKKLITRKAGEKK